MVSLCFILDNDYATHVYGYENLGIEYREVPSEIIVPESERKYEPYIGEIPVEMVFAVTDCEDKSLLIEYFSGVTEKVLTFDKGVNEATMMNDMIRACSGDHVCFIKPNVFVREHWLVDLLFYYQAIPKSGCISMLNDFAGYDYLPMLSMEDESSINVFIPKKNYLEDWGLLMVKRQYFYLVGAFDMDSRMRGCEWMQWMKRAVATGFVNYCIPTQTCYVASMIADSPSIESMEHTEFTLRQMQRSKNHYIPL